MQWFLSLSGAVQAFFASLLMYLMTALGAACVFLSGKINHSLLALLNGAAAGIMIAACFFSLLLPAIECETGIPSYFSVTIGFFFGGAFLICSDLALSRSKIRFYKAEEKRNALLFFAVTLHNLPEGMAVGVAFAGSAGGVSAALGALLLAIGVAVQNFPEGMCVAFPLRAGGMSAKKSFVLAQASGLVEIPACVLGAAIASASFVLPWALSFSAGAMIAVVCSELIPECFSSNKTLASAGVVVGFCLMMVLDLALG